MKKQVTLEPTVAITHPERKTTPSDAQKTKLLQTINFTLGSFDDKNRTFRAIASTPCVDRQGDTIAQDGWDLENFKNNPVVPWAHDYSQPPVARATEIGVVDGVLVFTLQFPQEGIYPFADTIWNLYRNQFMFAFSVGFIPDEPDEGWAWDGNDFKKAELLEISAVVVPANPQALALAAKQGVIDEAQTKQLIGKLKSATTGLEDALKASEVTKAALDATTKSANATDAAALVRSVLEEAGLLEAKSTDVEDLTDTNTNDDNEDMRKIKDVSESGDAGALAPLQHAGVKDMAESLKAAGDVLTEHAKALTDHSEVMKSHADLITEKAQVLNDAAQKLFDALDHFGATTSTEEANEADKDGDHGDMGDSKALDAAVTKDVTDDTATDEAAASDEDSSTTEADKATDETTDGEVKSDSDEADTEDTDAAENTAADVTEDEAAVSDGADHEESDDTTDDAAADDANTEKSVDEPETEHLFDPDNLTEEDVQKILDALNERAKQ